ncbi:trimethylamine methyltransferase family protein [Thermodesulfobacteriota bacterium]
MPEKSVTFPLKLLSDDQVEKIYQAGLKVLESTGVQFEDAQLLEVLQERGCMVDFESARVRFPPALVEKSLKTCPREFTVKARKEEHDLFFNGSRVYFASHSAPSHIEPGTGKKHAPSLKDVQDFISVIDALENIDVLLTVAGEVTDKPPEVGLMWVKAETFRRTGKTTTGPAFRDGAKWLIRMAEAVGAQIIGVTSCTPPLLFPRGDTDALMLYAEAGFPVTVGSGIALGGTGPVTLAGSLVQQTAETLAGVVLVQSSYPGTGMFYLTETAPIDMKFGDIAWGSMEVAMLAAAQAQLARFLGLQNFSLFPMSNSLICDEQAGFEKAMQSLILSLSGISFMAGGGGVHNEASLCIEQLIIDNDINGMIARFLQGIEVTDETLGIDVIEQVGLERGSFLKHPHTRKWFKQEHFFPHVINRLPHQRWEKTGSKDIVERARERAQEILQKHEPEPLPDEAEKELVKILKAVEKERLG